MRTRTRTILGYGRTQSQEALVDSFGIPYEFRSIEIPPQLDREYHFMVDSATRKDLVNDCYHLRMIALTGGGITPWCFDRELHNRQVSYWTDTLGKTHGTPTDVLVPSVITRFGERETLRPRQQELFQTDAYKKFAGGRWKTPVVSLSTGFSVVNFALEWRESLAMIKTYLSRRAYIERYHALLGRNQSLKGRAKALANERLGYVYGTKLFVQDAYKLFSILRDWKDRADMFVKEAGNVKRVYKEPVYVSSSGTPIVKEVNFPIFSAVDSFMRRERSIEYEFRAELHYCYSVPEFKGFLTRLAQLSDSLGIKLDAGIVWDAIPYTFVVDWFINIGEWLHRNIAITDDWFKITVKYLEHSTSVKAKRVDRYYWKRLVGVNNTYEDWLGSIYSTFYRREKAVLNPHTLKPVNIGLQGMKGWKLNRILNATSLAAQKILR